MAYKPRDLNTYVPGYTDLSKMDDQQVYDFSISQGTRSADATNATGELRRRSLIPQIARPMGEYVLPPANQGVKDVFGRPLGGSFDTPIRTASEVLNPAPWNQPLVPEGTAAGKPTGRMGYVPDNRGYADNVSAFARQMGQSVLGSVPPSSFDPQGTAVLTNSVADANLGIRQAARKNDTLTSKAERIVGDVMQTFGVPSARTANRGLQTAYASNTPRFYDDLVAQGTGTPASPLGYNLETLGEWGERGVFPSPEIAGPVDDNQYGQDLSWSLGFHPGVSNQERAGYFRGLGYGRVKRKPPTRNA